MSRPRNVAGPVVRGNDLWGREAEIAEIRILLGRGSVLLTGPRRHGKSSLMYALLDTPQKGVDVILLDVEWVETPQEFLTTMAAELLALDRVRNALARLRAAPTALTRWISGIVDEVSVGAGSVGELKVRLRSGLRDGGAWAELAEQVLGLLRSLDDRVVLVLDEFPIMVSNMLNEKAEIGLRFLRWFRTFRQSSGTEKLTFLLGGSTNIEPRLEALASEAVLGDLQRFRIRPFDRDRSLRFLKEVLDEEGVKYERGVPEAILAICHSGVPYYLQVMVAECLSEARHSARMLAVSDVRTVYEERVIGAVNRHRFSHYHTRLRGNYRELEEPARVVLANLCVGEKDVDSLEAALGASGHDPKILGRLLVCLEADYYITRDGVRVAFSDGLLRDWWIRNSVPPKVKT